MSALTRRTQILLDEDRHARLDAEARRTGRSVAAIIRDAIDARLSSPDATTRRAVAAAVLLDLARPEDPEPDWSTVKDARLNDALA